MTTGERIKILRILKGYTQQTLAEIAGVSRASVMLWEKGKLPTRRIATILSKQFEVSLDYLLKGTDHPLVAIWTPIAPGHPKHIPALATDLEHGIPKLFKELEINFAAKGKNVLGEQFMVCGNDPESYEWKLNFLLRYDPALDDILSEAVKLSGSKIINAGDNFSNEIDFVDECEDWLYEFYDRFPDCDLITENLAMRESEDDEFSLEGLLIRFGELVRERDIEENDVWAISKYIADELSDKAGINDIKISSTKLVNKAAVEIGARVARDT